MAKKSSTNAEPHTAAQDKSEASQARLAAETAKTQQKQAQHASEVADRELIRAQQVAYDMKQKLEQANIEAAEASKAAVQALQQQFGLAGETKLADESKPQATPQG